MEVSKINKHLEEILIAINNIDGSTKGVEAKQYSSYEISWIVERGIEIIAVALKRILVFDQNMPITNTQKIIATRNKITHEYDVIDSYQLYIIVVKYLPILKTEIETILNSK
jgi:uncharacterized protein with HEPN domain